MPGFNGPIYLPRRESTCFRGVYVGCHALALILLAGTIADPLLCAASIFGMLLIAAYSLSISRKPDVCAVLLTSDDGWRLSLADGSVVSASLSRAPIITQFLIVMEFCCSDATRRFFLLWSETETRQLHRRLGVRLRFLKR